MFAGYIYLMDFVHKGNHVYKIGKTIDIKRRLRELEQKFLGIKILDCRRFSNVEFAEMILHEMFYHKRYRGHYCEELFSLDDDDIAQYHQLVNAWSQNEPDWLECWGEWAKAKNAR